MNVSTIPGFLVNNIHIYLYIYIYIYIYIFNIEFKLKQTFKTTQKQSGARIKTKIPDLFLNNIHHELFTQRKQSQY